MPRVVSRHLALAGAAWDDGPAAGGWIAGRLAPFGPTLGHAVPMGYAAYAVVPIPDEDPDGDLGVIDRLLGILAPFTRTGTTHTGMWDGWHWWYDTGEDPRTAPGMWVGVSWSIDEERPSEEEIDRRRACGRERLARDRVERPDVRPLDLPDRRYHVWTGPPSSATALRHHPTPPSLIWPADRSWFVGVPIYTSEIAVAGTAAAIDAVLADPALDAHPAIPDHILAIDD